MKYQITVDYERPYCHYLLQSCGNILGMAGRGLECHELLYNSNERIAEIDLCLTHQHKLGLRELDELIGHLFDGVLEVGIALFSALKQLHLDAHQRVPRVLEDGIELVLGQIKFIQKRLNAMRRRR